MELLKLVIVDDEPILLQGLLDTYDWESMGFEVVGSAKSGVQALEVIRREQPHVVLTDIRMKQMTGLMVMDEYSNAIVHTFQRFRAPFSEKIVHIFPEQSAVI